MLIVGLDEAGAGPVWGSLWAAAVHLLPGQDWPKGLADSKRLSPSKRERLRAALEECCAYGLGEVTSHEIDDVGLARARRLVFERALDDLRVRFPDQPMPEHLIVDGTLFDGWHGTAYTCVPRADVTVPEASAASVMAKTERDRQVCAYCVTHPDLELKYALTSNKGYLSARHLEGLRTHGPSPLHRRSFCIKRMTPAPAPSLDTTDPPPESR